MKVSQNVCPNFPFLLFYFQLHQIIKSKLEQLDHPWVCVHLHICVYDRH